MKIWNATQNIRQQSCMAQTSGHSRAEETRIPKVREIVFICGSHHHVKYASSGELLHKLRTFFEARGYLVGLRMGRSPDDDVGYMSNLKYFYSTSGGLGWMIQELAKRMGAEVASN